MSISTPNPSALLLFSPSSHPLSKAKTFSSHIHGLSFTPLLKTGKKIAVKSATRFCNAQLAELAPATSAVYGTLLLGGGLYAFTRSGSNGSLLGGVSGAVLMATAYFLMQVPETKNAGDALGFGSAFIFCSVFGIRLAATRKLIPSGPLLGLSLGALAVFISAYLQDSI
ncbi:transmembrane proteins 14C [Tasmannia lanceolata]|uniref:transmembrane proteins 14C n=1 Tax=Tasmannia lanceolata TaxID=3420 RepID=UPI004064216F